MLSSVPCQSETSVLATASLPSLAALATFATAALAHPSGGDRIAISWMKTTT